MSIWRPKFALALSAMLAPCAAPGAAQAQGSAVAGARRYTQFCAGCHGVDGRGGDKALSLVTNQSLMNRPDSDLFRIVHDGTANGMPPFAQIGDPNISAVIHYLRSLEEDVAANGAAPRAPIAGNADAGRALFFGSAGCSQCHMVRGEGGFIAANLTTYAQNRSGNAVLQAITEPDSPLGTASRVVNVTTNSGEKVRGVLRNEDEFNLAIQSEDGRYHFFSRSDLAEINYSDHSLMPSDYDTRLTTKELDDIVSFLMASGRGSKLRAEQDRQH